MKIVLISTYELGRQPFGLASPAAWLRARGHAVDCLDLSRESLDEARIGEAGLVAFYVPMHTATRLAVEWIEPVRRLNPRAALCFYGLYAPVNEAWLRDLGVAAILGGEFEEGLARLADRLAAGASANGAQPEPVISLERQQFLLPDRSGLVPLGRYARLVVADGSERIAGYTEASRGCKHRCRHCPVVPVYNGVFRVVQPEVVLEDIRRQVAAGAQHITFGDPDFFNGPRHALGIVRELHRRFPALTYDVTIKVEHLLARRGDLAALEATGCLFVTTAVESVDDAVLALLEKSHTRADFFELVPRFREAGLALHPTFVPFTPWTTLAGYADLIETLRSLDLVENVAPVQLAIRLLVPAGSRLLELDDVRRIAEPFDRASLAHPWRHPDERVDALQQEIEALVKRCHLEGTSRVETFGRIERVARQAAGLPPVSDWRGGTIARAAIPFLTEPWYC
ncbi:MAG TPA: CUAEP/CCAEP-tail radical SAM protein [Candidatus Acidoferrales bacterium]|nr:CUAEP/CCAEP-tail radical SAM protein [Candidatus Acidoferrales bacterium]